MSNYFNIRLRRSLYSSRLSSDFFSKVEQDRKLDILPRSSGYCSSAVRAKCFSTHPIQPLCKALLQVVLGDCFQRIYQQRLPLASSYPSLAPSVPAAMPTRSASPWRSSAVQTLGPPGAPAETPSPVLLASETSPRSLPSPPRLRLSINLPTQNLT